MKHAWTAAVCMLAILAAQPLAAQQAAPPLSITPRPPVRPSAARPAVSPPTPAASAPSPAVAVAPTIDQVNAYLNTLTQLIGNFSQVGPDGRRSAGKLYVRRPGRLRFEYDPPSPLEIVADGTSVILRDRKLATQDLYALSQTPLKFLVAERIDLRRDVTIKSARLKGDSFTVVIEDRSTFGGTSRIALTFDAKVTTLRHWVVTDPQGYDTTVTLSNLDTSKRPDDKLFVIDYQRILQ
ncbi:MAG: outer membrane lipoprotein carrier protein LolA [Hyphomicrobiales bacterium]